MIQAGVSNLPTDLESASRALGGAGKQKDGKKLIRLFCVEGAAPADHPEEWQRFLTYACQDVEAMRDVYRRTRPLPLAEWRAVLGVRAHQSARRGGRHALRAPRRRPGGRGRRRHWPPAGRADRRGRHPVTQAKRIATWLHDQLADAAMREVLTLGVPADDDDDDDDDGADELQPDARSRRPRARHARGQARQRRADARRDQGPRGRDPAPLRRRRLAEKVRAPRCATSRRRAARPVSFRRRRADRPHELARARRSKT